MIRLFCAAAILLSWSSIPQSYATPWEMFGTGSSTLGIGKQSTGDEGNASNHFYTPSLLGFADSHPLYFGFTHIATDFEPINGVLIENDATNSDGDRSGDIDTDYPTTQLLSIHGVFNLTQNKRWKIPVSLVIPANFILEGDSGDTFNPEYVMYKSRPRRISTGASVVHRLGTHWSLSLGGIFGFSTSSRLDARQSLNGSPNGSSGQLKVKVKPVAGALVGASYKTDKGNFSFTYQQEMKTKLRSDIDGSTISPTFPYNNTLSSLFYYDPHIFRTHYTHKLEEMSFHLTLEYQLWDNYETPIVRLSDNGGSLKASDNYESTVADNIFVPKLGYRWDFLPTWAWSLGYEFRPTPLQGDFSGAGNSIDTDSQTFTSGVTKVFTLAGKAFTSSLAAAYQILDEKNVVKSSGQEDGTSGTKIGSPGYTVGGSIVTIALDFQYGF